MSQKTTCLFTLLLSAALASPVAAARNPACDPANGQLVGTSTPLLATHDPKVTAAMGWLREMMKPVHDDGSPDPSAPITGLIRSYEYLPGQDGYGTSRTQNTYIYDQALSLLVAVAAGDRGMADQLLIGLLSTQTRSGDQAGAFPSGVEQRNPNADDPSYHVGGNAFAAYAMLRYLREYGDQHGVGGAVDTNLGWLRGMLTTSGPASGLYRGGVRRENGQWVQIGWHSTEYNIDMWHVWELAARTRGGDHRQRADDLAANILSKLWNDDEHRFNQGFDDTEHALDTASWGSIFLSAIGEIEKSRQSLEHTERFRVERDQIRGYAAAPPAAGLSPNVWFEGSFGVVHGHAAFARRDRAFIILNGLYPARRNNGVWPYYQAEDIAEERTSANSVASTAWFLLAAAYPQGLWNECLPG